MLRSAAVSTGTGLFIERPSRVSASFSTHVPYPAFSIAGIYLDVSGEDYHLMGIYCFSVSQSDGQQHLYIPFGSEERDAFCYSFVPDWSSGGIGYDRYGRFDAVNRMLYLKNVSTLTLDRNNCTGCGMCLEVCPHEVFTMEGSKALIVNKDGCMECGACMINCPVSAIEVEKGVGCAYAVIDSKLKGRDEITCGCDGSENSGGSGCCS